MTKDFATVTPDSGNMTQSQTITVSAQPNETASERTTTITLTAVGSESFTSSSKGKKTITIVQSPNVPQYRIAEFDAVNPTDANVESPAMNTWTTYDSQMIVINAYASHAQSGQEADIDFSIRFETNGVYGSVDLQYDTPIYYNSSGGQVNFTGISNSITVSGSDTLMVQFTGVKDNHASGNEINHAERCEFNLQDGENDVIGRISIYFIDANE